MHLSTTQPTNAPSLGYNPLIHNYYQFFNHSKMRDFSPSHSILGIPTTSPDIIFNGYMRVSPNWDISGRNFLPFFFPSWFCVVF